MRSSLVAVIILAVAVVVVYWNSLPGEFVLDDNASILENPQLRAHQPLTAVLTPPDQDPEAPRWRGPVVGLSLALNHAQGAFEPRGYHVFNLLAHLLVTLALYGCIRAALGRDEGSGVALASALLWAVHPLLTDSVTYVIQRTTVLMGLFYMVGLLAILRSDTARRPRTWHVVALVSCLLGMLSKESMVTAPVMYAIADRVFLAPSWREVWRRRRLLYIGLAATWLALAWIMVVSPHAGNIGLDVTMGPVGYLLTQPEVIWHYLLLVVWPRDLILDYGFAEPVAFGAALLPGLLLVGLLVITALGFRGRSRLAFLGAWFFITLSPTSSVVPIVKEVGAERRMYLPLMALVVLGVIGGRWLLRRLVRTDRVRTGWAVALVAVIAGALGAVTVDRNRDYHDPLALWQETVRQRPRNVRAHSGLGVALVREGRLEEAEVAYCRALEIDAAYPEAAYNLGRALSRLERHDEALEAYLAALELTPDNFKAHNNAGNTLLRLGRPAEAEVRFRDVIRLDPSGPFGHNGLGLALWAQGQLEQAAEQFEAALARRPSYDRARQNLARVREELAAAGNGS